MHQNHCTLHHFLYGCVLSPAEILRLYDEDQLNTIRHVIDLLEVPRRPITRAREKRLKETLNELVQNIWSKMDLEKFGLLDHVINWFASLLLLGDQMLECVN